jgi:hypothetical protein
MITQGYRCSAEKKVKICGYHLSKVEAVELEIEEGIWCDETERGTGSVSRGYFILFWLKGGVQFKVDYLSEYHKNKMHKWTRNA